MLLTPEQLKQGDILLTKKQLIEKIESSYTNEARLEFINMSLKQATKIIDELPKIKLAYAEDLIFSVFFRLFGILDQSVKYLFYKGTISKDFDKFIEIFGELKEENLISCYKKIESLRENTTVLSDGIERKVSYSIRQLWNFIKHEHAIVITSSTDSKEEIEKFQNRGVCDDVVSKIFIPLRNLIEYWVSLI